ncbi:unnamed protein product [Nippostrongylus brasiliensis]|uniref:Reverse transcriptase domain-containing protein n=1 Tax=Nippostrongylus brasiliensis TaxID=27835 RepID=A0A0N4YZJ7_NIPBR|nr:unnamed protein product [Nippostrongylus brasiliensis]
MSKIETPILERKPLLYCRYIDDCFIVCATQEEMDLCFDLLNNQAENIKLTREKPTGRWLPYLNVQICPPVADEEGRCQEHVSNGNYGVVKQRPEVGVMAVGQSHCHREWVPRPKHAKRYPTTGSGIRTKTAER